MFLRKRAMNAPLSIGIIGKDMLPAGAEGNGMPDFGEPSGKGMMPPPGKPPGEEDITQLWKDDVIWYRNHWKLVLVALLMLFKTLCSSAIGLSFETKASAPVRIARSASA